MPETQPGQAAISRYQYVSLAPQSREIRLLELFPGDWNDRIRCSIQAVSLDSKPVYETISYAWGESNDTKMILLNGHEVGVRNNLESALRHLRKPNKALSLWADSLCIDQKNDYEKTNQVLLMGEIYRSCSRVYIWLGLPECQPRTDSPLETSSTAEKYLLVDDTSTPAWHNPFSLVQHFAEDKHFFELPGYVTSLSLEEPFRFEEEPFQRCSQGMHSISNSSWWTRLWCLQEAWLPPDALAIFGRWRMKWDKFGDAERHRQRHQRSPCCERPAKLMTSRFAFSMDHVVLSTQPPTAVDDTGSLSKRFSLDYMLRTYRYRDCQDPRDKVYSLLGLVQTRESQKILPDYSLPLKDVLINAMEAVILESNGDLRCLTGSGFGSQREGVPTWARDLTSKPNASTRESKRLDRYTMYSASKFTVSGAVQRDRTKLILKGITFDRIRSVSEPAYASGDLHDFGSLLVDWHHVAGLNYQDPISLTSNSKQEVFWRTVVGDIYLNPKNERKRMGSSELKEYERCISELSFSGNPTIASSVPRNFYLALLTAIRGRSMFITENGNIGLCEPTARAGDEVWVLHGGRVPFILRPLRRQALDGSLQHAFIGDCHVTGFMYGEAYEHTSHIIREVILE